MTKNRTLRVLSAVAALVLVTVGLPAQFQLGRSASGNAARSIGNWAAGMDQRSDASASYSTISTCASHSTFTNDLDLLGQSTEAVHFDLDLHGSVFTSIYGGGSRFVSRYGGAQQTSMSFQSDRDITLSRPLTFLAFGAARPRTTVWAGWTRVTLDGAVTVTTDLNVRAEVQNGSPNRVAQSGTMTAAAVGSVSVVSAGTTTTLDVDLDFGSNTLKVGHGASSGLGWFGGQVFGGATHTFGAFNLYLRVCSQFGLPGSTLCTQVVEDSAVIGLAQVLFSV
ncbi:MAG: hypothetical protein AAF628_23575 [Planctomycetota bacterium]